MSSIFISYRQIDSAASVARLREWLCREIGEDAVFEDVYTVLPGERWREEIREKVSLSEAVLLVIGRQWSLSRSADDSHEDWVRFEITTALQEGKFVVPLLVDGAARPDERDLPPGTEGLAQLQCLSLSNDYRYEVEFGKLLDSLRLHVPKIFDLAASRRFDFARDDREARALEIASSSTPREWALARVEEWIGSGRSRFLLIVGSPGTGKSILAAQLVRRAQGRLSAFHFCRALDSTTLHPLLFCQAIAAQLARSVPGYLRGVECDPRMLDSAQDAFQRLIVRPLTNLRPRADVLVLVDAIDEAQEHPGTPTIVDLIAKTSLPEGFRFILTLRPGGDFDRLSDLLSAQQSQRVDVVSMNAPEALAEVRDYVRDAVREHPTTSLGARDPEALALELFQSCEGNFLVVHHTLEMLRKAGQDGHPDLESLPAGLDETYRCFLQRLERHRGSDAAWRRDLSRVLGLLSTARAPLAWRQLTALAGIGGADLQAVLDVLGQFLVVGSVAEQETFSFYHRSLADFLVDRTSARQYWCDPVEYHWRFRELYLKQPVDWQRCDEYGLRHIVFHCLASDASTLPPPLEDPGFWRVRLLRTGAPGLLEDLSLAKGQFPDDVRPLRKALIRESPRVQSSDQEFRQVLQQLDLELTRERDVRWRAVIRRHLDCGGGHVRGVWSSPAPGDRSLVCELANTRSRVKALAVDAGRHRVFAGSWLGGLSSWDLRRHGPVFSVALTGSPPCKILPVTSSAADETVWVALTSGEIVLLSALSGEVRLQIAGAGEPVGALAHSPDGRTLMVGDTAGDVTFWDVHTRRLMSRHSCGSDPIVDAAPSGAGGEVVTLSRKGKLTVWSVEDGRFVHAVRARWGGASPIFHAVVPHDDGSVVCAADSSVLVVSLRDGAVTELAASPTQVLCLARDRASRTLVSAGRDGKIRSHPPGPGRSTVIAQQETPIVELGLDSLLGVMVSGDEAGRLRLWELGTTESASVGEGHSLTIGGLSFCEGRLVSMDAGGHGCFWTESGRNEDRFVLDGDRLWRAVSLSGTGRLVGKRDDEPPMVWDVQSRRPLGRRHSGGACLLAPADMETPTAARSGEEALLAVDEAGQVAVACRGEAGSPVVCWNLESGKAIAERKERGERVTALAFARDSTTLAVGSRALSWFDPRYSATEFAEVTRQETQRAPAVAVRLYRPPFQEPEHVWGLPLDDDVTALAVGPDSVLAGTSAGRLRRLSSGQADLEIPSVSARVTAIAWLEGGRNEAIVGHEDGTVSWVSVARAEVLDRWVMPAGITCLAMNCRLVAIGTSSGSIDMVELVP